MTIRRSVLYMPSSNERALEKAKAIDCDALIFDLEDAVAPDAKEAARANAVAAAASGDYGHRELTIRCNGLDTPWGADDLAAAATAGASAVVVPKVGSLDDVAAIDAALSAAGAPDDLGIWAMIETPSAIFNVREIAGAARVAALVMGTNDLYRELGAQMVVSRHPVLPHLATALAAAREAQITALDGVYNNVRDPDGFAAEAQQGFEMGFDGKTLIHPSQVAPTNDIWSPDPVEIDHARRVIEEFDLARREGRGVMTVDGRMIENLHVAMAQRTLAVADAVAARPAG